jgi:hypothetical protein
MSIKTDITDFLIGRDWVFGGVIEDYIRAVDKHKASNASRRCRELYQEGKLERRMASVPGVSNLVVQYRLVSKNLLELIK